MKNNNMNILLGLIIIELFAAYMDYMILLLVTVVGVILICVLSLEYHRRKIKQIKRRIRKRKNVQETF